MTTIEQAAEEIHRFAYPLDDTAPPKELIAILTRHFGEAAKDKETADWWEAMGRTAKHTSPDNWTVTYHAHETGKYYLSASGRTFRQAVENAARAGKEAELKKENRDHVDARHALSARAVAAEKERDELKVAVEAEIVSKALAPNRSAAKYKDAGFTLPTMETRHCRECGWTGNYGQSRAEVFICPQCNQFRPMIHAVPFPTGSAGQPGEVPNDALNPDLFWLHSPHGCLKRPNYWHNPAGLSRDQIGDGYRPLTVEEAKCVPEGAEFWTDLKRWAKSMWIGLRSADAEKSYRVPTRTSAPPTSESAAGTAQCACEEGVTNHLCQIHGSEGKVIAERDAARRTLAERDAEIAALRTSLSEALAGTLTVHAIPRGEQSAEVVRLTAELASEREAREKAEAELRDTKAAAPSTAAIRAEIAAAFDALAELFRERQFAVMSLSDCFNNVAAKLRRE